MSPNIKKKIKMEKIYLKNLAGVQGCNDIVIAELTFADIKHHVMPVKLSGEVPTNVIGYLDPSGWGFTRAWTYWVCKGPGIPPDIAEELHKTHGNYVRVAGHCGCPSPLEWYKGFAVGSYHVDTLEGLKALADTIKAIIQQK